MMHNCTFELDLDGQVTCSNCGAMDDDMLPRRTYNDNDKQTISPEHFENQVDFE
jgi:hypothetical protein